MCTLYALIREHIYIGNERSNEGSHVGFWDNTHTWLF